jgi:hypothetical protein
MRGGSPAPRQQAVKHVEGGLPAVAAGPNRGQHDRRHQHQDHDDDQGHVLAAQIAAESTADLRQGG